MSWNPASRCRVSGRPAEWGPPFERKPGEHGYESKRGVGKRDRNDGSEQRERKRERRETEEGRNPINLFIKRFSCLCRGLSDSHGKYEPLKRTLSGLASESSAEREGIATTDRIPVDQPRILTP